MKSHLEENSIWLLHGARAGDNAQTRALSSRFDVPVIEKQLEYNALYMVPNALKGASLASLNPQARELIKPPWPRVVIATGKRSVAIARYINEQSGGKTRLVQIGRPRANLAAFDLVLTTPQYGLLAADNVIELPVPLSPIVSDGSDEEKAFQDELAGDKSRPFIVVVTGGNSSTQKFTVVAAQKLAELSLHHAEGKGGSVFAISSPRTPDDVVGVLKEKFAEPAVFLPWRKTQVGEVNPYPALLAMADEVIITSDSASMISDGLTLGKKVLIFQLPTGILGRFAHAVQFIFKKLDKYSVDGWMWSRFLILWRVLRKYGLINPPRHMNLLIDGLFEQGLATPLPSGISADQKGLKTAKKDDFSTILTQRINDFLK